MKKLNDEQKKKVIENLKKVDPKLSEEDIKKKIDSVKLEKINDEELANVSGGGILTRPPIDENKRINGWTYADLRNILFWCYESYQSKDITIGLAFDIIPSAFWEKYLYCDYPAFILEPMWRIWCPNELGF